MLLLPASHYQIKKTRKKGRGVFVVKEIPGGAIIGDYLGLLIKDAQAEIMERKYSNACYAMDYNNNGLSIFPVDIRAAGLHLINHSCAPNCEAYFYQGHTLYFALRRILPGEELTISYDFDPDNSDQKEHLFPCFCGSLFCRGTMYVSAARLRRYHDFYRQESKGQKFKTLKAGEILRPLEKYPASIKDNSIFNLFANPDASPVIYQDMKMPSRQELRRRLRASGRILNFQRLGLKVSAIMEGKVVLN